MSSLNEQLVPYLKLADAVIITDKEHLILAVNPAELAMGKNIILYHHKKWDGTGYPQKLFGESIPIEARIVSVAACDCLYQRTARPPF